MKSKIWQFGGGFEGPLPPSNFELNIVVTGQHERVPGQRNRRPDRRDRQWDRRAGGLYRRNRRPGGLYRRAGGRGRAGLSKQVRRLLQSGLFRKSRVSWVIQVSL